MSAPIQTGSAAVGTAGLAAASGYGITTYVKNDIGSKEIIDQDAFDNASIPNVFTFETLRELDSPYKGKVLDLVKKTNLAYLVKTSNTSNQKWWKWAYENKFSNNKEDSKLHVLFKNVNSSQLLKNACENAYKKNKSDYKFEDTDYLLKNISDYCTKGTNSFDVSEPQLVVYSDSSTPTGYENGLLSVDSNRGKLVKSKVDTNETTINNNDLWWDWAFKNLVKDKNSSSNDLFKNLEKGYEKTEETVETSSNKKALNWACDAAYKKLYFELKASSVLVNNIKNFCSVNPNTTLLSLPVPGKPSFVSTKADDKSKYATENSFVKLSGNKDKLVDPNETQNQNWWIWTFDKQYPKETSKYVEPFLGITSGYSTNEADTALNKACEKAYNKTSKDFQNNQEKGNKIPLFELIKRFCSPKEEAKSLQEFSENG